MQISPQMQAIGCVNSLVYLGALVSGLYQGVSAAKGNDIDSGVIKYGPIVLAGILGIPGASIFSADESNLDEIMSNVPYESRQAAQGCAKGCMSIGFPVIGASVAAGLEYLGYVIGNAVSSNT